MKKVIAILALCIMLCTGVYAAVEPEIIVNGATGSVGVNSDTLLTLSVKLSPGDKEGTPADWWLLAYGFGKWYYYQLDNKWIELGDKLDLEKLRPTYQGRLFTVNPIEIGQLPKLAAGNYTLYFGVDTKRNGKLDWDSLVFKSMSITVSESGKRSDFVTAGSRNTLDVYAGAAGDGTTIPTTSPPKDQSSEVAREIEEADMIKVEGSYLYILNRYKGLMICDISTPDAPFIVGRAAVTGNPTEMYIRDNRAYVILSANYPILFGIMPAGVTDLSYQVSRIQIIDITDKTAPKLAGNFDLTGNVTDSRIVGNILYAVSSEQSYYWYYEKSDSSSADTRNVYVVSIDISDVNNIREVNSKDFGGTASYIHVTDKAIFVASGDKYVWSSDNTSTITYVDISDPAGQIITRGSISVAGSVNDKYKMDYSDGYFRVCTYQWKDSGISYLSVIDVKNPDKMLEVGKVELAKGEQLFATRFDGNRAYMVTYERKDPLWVIDLSDPTKPAIKGELIVPGWSTHIEPKGDRLIALGVDDTDGWKVAVSLFDVSNPETPTLVDKVSFGNQGGWSSSTAHNDVKAFTVMDEMGLILLPYNTSSKDESGNYSYDSRLQLIDYSKTDLNARGWISQKGSVLRSRSAANRLFSVSDDELQVIDATDRDNPRITADIALAINITDFKPLANGYGVQITESNGKYALRTVSLSDPENSKAVGELALENTSYSNAFVNGNLIYLVSGVYSYYLTPVSSYRPYIGKTQIQVLDFSTPTSPKKRGTIEIEGTYATSPIGVISLYPYYNQGQILQMNGTTLICPYSEGYWGPYYYDYDASGSKEGSSEEPSESYNPKSGVRIIDLSDPDNPKLTSELTLKAETGISGYFLNGKTLYFSHSEAIEQDSKGRSQSKYYLGRIDLSDISAPVQKTSVNIPGTCFGTDVSGMYAYTFNTEWKDDEYWSQNYTLNIVRLENDKAYLVSQAKLGGYMSNVVLSDGFAYMGSKGISIADLRTPENLLVYSGNYNKGWASILGVKNKKIFASVSGGVACYDATNPASLKLDEMKNSYGYRIEFSNTSAYLPLGYYGVWVISLNP